MIYFFIEQYNKLKSAYDTFSEKYDDIDARLKKACPIPDFNDIIFSVDQKIYSEFGLPALHSWGDGFVEGDASEEELKELAGNYDEDGQITYGFSGLDWKYIEMLEEALNEQVFCYKEIVETECRIEHISDFEESTAAAEAFFKRNPDAPYCKVAFGELNGETLYAEYQPGVEPDDACTCHGLDEEYYDSIVVQDTEGNGVLWLSDYEYVGKLLESVRSLLDISLREFFDNFKINYEVAQIELDYYYHLDTDQFQENWRDILASIMTCIEEDAVEIETDESAIMQEETKSIDKQALLSFLQEENIECEDVKIVAVIDCCDGEQQDDEEVLKEILKNYNDKEEVYRLRLSLGINNIGNEDVYIIFFHITV